MKIKLKIRLKIKLKNRIALQSETNSPEFKTLRIKLKKKS